MVTSEPMAWPKKLCGRDREVERLSALLAPALDHSHHEPAIALIHGMPGVGKTALAVHVANSFPGPGPLVIELGNSRDAVEIDAMIQSHRHLIDATAKPAIVVLDGLTDPHHIETMLAEGVRAVVATSRRDIGASSGIASMRLGVLDDDGALDMFFEVAAHKKELGLPRVDLLGVLEIVERCGRLPSAIRFAAGRWTGNSASQLLKTLSLQDARTLREDSGFEAHIEAEYGWLSDADQRDLALLSQIESRTFCPWALAAMSGIDREEARDICARLAEAELIDPVSANPDPREPRYRLHPLVRLFAQDRLKAKHALSGHAARERLNETYHELVIEAIAGNDRDFRPPEQTSRLVAEFGDVTTDIMRHPDEWFREHYANVARVLDWAYGQQYWGLCRRIGVRLGGIIPDGVPIAEVHRLRELAVKAAEIEAHETGDALGLVEAHLAATATLTAVESYPAVDRLLRQTLGLLEGIADSDGVRLLRGKVHKRWAEGYVQMRHCELAEKELRTAADIFAALPAKREQALTSTLQHLLYDSDLRDDQTFAQLLEDVGPPDEFWVVLQQFEQVRRSRKAWAQARGLLDWAYLLAAGDLRRDCNLRYRDARLYIDEWKSTPELEHQRLVRLSVRRGLEAIARFQRMGNKLGQFRTTFRVVQALIEAGERSAANAYLPDLQEVEQLRDEAGSAYEPIEGRARFTHALYRHAIGDAQRADQEMRAAIRLFEAVADYRSELDANSKVIEWGPRPPERPDDPILVGDRIKRGDPRFALAKKCIHDHLVGQSVPPPSCFISYAHDDWVWWARNEFAADLDSAGFTIHIDVKDVDSITALEFQEKLPLADIVIAIGTPEYRRRYRTTESNAEGQTVGHNVHLEVLAILRRIRDRRPVMLALLDGEFRSAFPDTMPEAMLYDFRVRDNYVPQLLALIFRMLRIEALTDPLVAEVKRILGGDRGAEGRSE